MMAEKAAIETWLEKKIRLTKWLGVEMKKFESRWYLFYLLLKY